MHRFSCFRDWTFHFKTVYSAQKGRERKSLLCAQNISGWALSYLTLCCFARNRPPPHPEHILWPNTTLITHRGLTYQCKEWEGERRDLAQAQTTGAYSVALHEFNAQKGGFSRCRDGHKQAVFSRIYGDCSPIREPKAGTQNARLWWIIHDCRLFKYSLISFSYSLINKCEPSCVKLTLSLEDIL